MRKSSLLHAGLLATGLLLAAHSHAAYEGPGATPSTLSIAEILKNPVEDQLVTLQGKLLKKIGKEEYLFSDGKDSIRVEIDDKDMQQVTVTESSLVEITGEVDKKLFGGPEIEVQTIRLVTP
ncbi:MAG: NirD/YgiW/YdeI family stress tolerance protein [Moraxellaceae bacterium]